MVVCYWKEGGGGEGGRSVGAAVPAALGSTRCWAWCFRSRCPYYLPTCLPGCKQQLGGPAGKVTEATSAAREAILHH